MATMGGAAVLRREDEIGSLEPGKAADLIAFDLNDIAFAGAADPVAALVHCAADRVDFSIVNGEWRVKDGRLLAGDAPKWIARHNELARQLTRA